MKIKRDEVRIYFEALSTLNSQKPKGVEFSFIKNASVLRKAVKALGDDMDEFNLMFCDKQDGDKSKPLIAVTKDAQGNRIEQLSFESLSSEEVTAKFQALRKIREEIIDIPLKKVKASQIKNLRELDSNAVATLLDVIIIDDMDDDGDAKEDSKDNEEKEKHKTKN